MLNEIEETKNRNESEIIKDTGVIDKDTITEEEKKQALELLESPLLVQRHLDYYSTRYIEREAELLLVKLATVSRKFSEGLSVIIKGSSSVGKSKLIRTVLETVWPEDKEDFTRVTKNYLLYRDKPLKHKILTIFEMQGAMESAHIIRNALSEGVLKLGTVDSNKKSGLKSMESEKETSGLVFLSTYAGGNIDWELDTRILKIELSHDENLTRKVFKHKANTIRPQNINNRIFQIADHLLEPLDVLIPFSDRLAERFPVDQERYMRDFDKVLTLIKSSALLHQHQREKDSNGALIATPEDYKLVYSLKDLISESVSPLSPNLIYFLKTASDLNCRELPTRTMLCKKLNKTDKTIRNYIDQTDNFITKYGIGVNQKIKVTEIPEMINPLPSPDDLFSDNYHFQFSNNTQATDNKGKIQEIPLFPVLIQFPETGQQENHGKLSDFQKKYNKYRKLGELEKWKMETGNTVNHSEGCDCIECTPLDDHNLDFDINDL